MSERRYGPYGFDASNEDKPLFGENGPTKGRLIAYYEKVAEHLLPHTRERPLVLHRFPDGIDRDGFYQKQIGSHFPDWVDRVEVALRSGGEQTLVVASKRATLAYLADQAAIELHPWLCRADRLERPDRLVVDLDPPEGSDAFDAVCEAARKCRALLDALELTSFVKTTGSRGLHVVVPLDRSADFDAARAFAKDAMDLLATRYADTLTTEPRKDARKGRLYLDVARNAFGQTAVAPYAVRARPGAPVATPLAWEELSRDDLDARRFNIGNVLARLARVEDPWAGMRRHAHSISAARERLDRLEAADAG